MADPNKRRTNSFRKLFPSLFSSHKSKDKKSKVALALSKSSSNSPPANNHYQNPKSIPTPEKFNSRHKNTYESCIYENLIVPGVSLYNDTSGTLSNLSSSSTLVSENMKCRKYSGEDEKSILQVSQSVCAGAGAVCINQTARPQVPPRPHEPHPQSPISDDGLRDSQYPDIYYHSLEKLSDHILPIEDLEIHKKFGSPTKPEPVSAEIKRVSTKFLVSPKKEAEVRTLQPTRAQSLPFDEYQEDLQISKPIRLKNIKFAKPYNYSAPTSPIPVNHKLPNMPKTVSSNQQIRKALMEAEEKRNCSRSSLRNDSTPLPRPHDGSDRSNRISSPTSPASTLSRNCQKKINDEMEKERARQSVEVFYWQKLKELKEKEEEYFLRQSMTSQTTENRISNSNCRTPLRPVIQPRSFSLPRGQNICTYSVRQATKNDTLFVRGASERRTDTFLMNRGPSGDTDIIYRHPEKLNWLGLGGPSQDAKRALICQINNVMPNCRNANQQRFNPGIHQSSRKIISDHNFASQSTPNDAPRPPVRTTSVKDYNIGSKNDIVHAAGRVPCSESESGSEAGEIQRIFQITTLKEEDWHGDGSRMDGGLSDGEAGRSGPRGSNRPRPSRRDDPRRHTLAGNHLYVHPHHPSQISSLDIEQLGRQGTPEYATVTKPRDMKPYRFLDPHMRKPPLPRYPPPSSNLLFDDDPGIMSEVETSSTGFRRGGKQRSSLPVVRTPSKTLERPLGLVFLQYRSETKRALLPNEITSIDTVKALFVRSFPKQLTMQYMDSPMVKIYIHDSNKDMFYELEDVRAHLRDIRDRSVLRLFEATDMTSGVFPGAVGVGSLAIPPPVAPPCSGPSSWDQEQSYFSEPEIDSEYHHQHVHKSKVKAPAYYMGTSAPNTLPRGGSLLRAFSPAAPPVPADRGKAIPSSGGGRGPTKPARAYLPTGSDRGFPYAPDHQLYTIPGHGGEGYMSSPERSAARVPYEDPYYTQYLGPAAVRPTITPIIDEEISDGVIVDDSYQMYGAAITAVPRPMPRPPYDARINPQVDDMQRLRVEKMERQLANLTGLVQKALQTPGSAPTVAPREFATYAAVPRPQPQDGARYPTSERPPKLGRDKFQKSVSFEKSVSFSDDPPDMNSPKQHSPQHSADTKPTKPAIKSSTLPRTSSQERDRLKPAPPPKPAGLAGQPPQLAPQRTYTINVSPDFFNQLRVLQKQSRDLRLETRNLRRSTLSHAMQMRQMMADTIVKIGTLAASFSEHDPDSQLTREEEIYRQDMLLLENDLYELEATVERLRGQAANRETRVNMADIERIAMVLSKSSKTVADWKLKFPLLQDTMKVKLASEMEKVVRKEKMLEEEPERLELALRRCKKLTGTLVTLKRLACVQEQRLPLADGRVSPGSSQSSSFTAGPSSEEFASDINCHPPAPPVHNKGDGSSGRRGADVRPENALDALLDELQTFAKPAAVAAERARAEPPLRRLHSYPSGSDTDASPPVRARGHHPPKPPVPERHPELLALAQRRAPPPPPPRTTSRSPIASPPSTSPTSPPADPAAAGTATLHNNHINHDGVRQAILEQRHQELLKKQKALQEQYARLQMIQRTGPALPPNAQPDLKKTGSESNLLTKMSLNLTAATTGSMTHLAAESDCAPRSAADSPPPAFLKLPDTTTNKVYETDIL